MSLKTFTIAIAIVATGIAGGSVAASDYPPDVAPPSTVQSSTVGGTSSGRDAEPSGQGVQGLQRSGTLAATGSDSGDLVKIAGGALIAGAGLVAVTRRRRHPSAA
jgi:LPXTG-motif cell wall-anchored protein